MTWDAIIVGAGITGLTCAYKISTYRPDAKILVLDASERPGGPLWAGTFDNHHIDLGAESLLAIRPEAVALAHDLGLGDQITAPISTSASILHNGQLLALPARTVMGIPADLTTLQPLFTPAEIAAMQQRDQAPMAPLTHDITVGHLLRDRLGDPVVDRLVEPLLGGVYAGHADQISLQAAIPTLWERIRHGQPVLQATAAMLPAPTNTPTRMSAVFAGITGGVGTLIPTLLRTLHERGVHIHPQTTVTTLARTGGWWRLTTTQPTTYAARAVILACPAAATGHLLGDHLGTLQTWLTTMPTASMALVCTKVPRSVLADTQLSGFLVPPTAGLRIKAATFASRKWQWIGEQDPHHDIIRMSLGRAGDTTTVNQPDHTLISTAVRDLETVLGETVPIQASHVVRYHHALPQYQVGHLDRVTELRQAVGSLEALAVAGASYDGVGIPACVASAQNAARQIINALG